MAVLIWECDEVEITCTPAVKATEIHALYLQEEFRSRGISARLITEFVRWSEQRGGEVVEVDVFTSNTLRK